MLQLRWLFLSIQSRLLKYESQLYFSKYILYPNPYDVIDMFYYKK